MTMMHTRRSSVPSSDPGASGRAEFAQAVDLDNFRRLRRRGATITRSYRLRPADGEDVVQEALIRMMRASESADETPKRFDSYFDSTVRHLCIDFLRTNGRETELPEPEQLPVASKAERQDQRILVHQVLSEMPASSRSILVKSHIEGRSLSEIAGELGISSNACSAMLYRARRTFRDRYVRSHVLPTDDEQCAAIRALMVDSALAVGSEYEIVVANHRRECDDCESQYAFLLTARSAAASALLPGGLAAATAGGFLGFIGLGSMRSSGSGGSGAVVGAVAAVAVVAVGATAFAITSARQGSTASVNPTPSNSAGAGNAAPPVATLPSPTGSTTSADNDGAAITIDPADVPMYFPPVVTAPSTPVVRATPRASAPTVVPTPQATTPAPAPTTPAPEASSPPPPPPTPTPTPSPTVTPEPPAPVDFQVPGRTLAASEQVSIDITAGTSDVKDLVVTFVGPDGSTFNPVFLRSATGGATADCTTEDNRATFTLPVLAAGQPLTVKAGYLKTVDDAAAVVNVTVTAADRASSTQKLHVAGPVGPSAEICPVVIHPDFPFCLPYLLAGNEFTVPITAGDQPITSAYLQLTAPGAAPTDPTTGLGHWLSVPPWRDADQDADDGVRYDLSFETIEPGTSRTLVVRTAAGAAVDSYNATIKVHSFTGDTNEGALIELETVTSSLEIVEFFGEHPQP